MDKRPRIIGRSRLLALPELADDRIGPLIGVVAVDDNAGESTARHPEAQCQHQADQRLDWLPHSSTAIGAGLSRASTNIRFPHLPHFRAMESRGTSPRASR